VKIVQLTPGTGSFYCGACIRDNALVAGLRELGHDATLIPLYLPFLVDEQDESQGQPILLGGINMYLQQVSRIFRHTPRFLDRLFDARALLGLAARRATMTRPESLGELTLSTLRGESGHQAKEVRRLAEWIGAHDRPDVVCLSNALLSGVARRIREELGEVKIVATLQGEDAFLDSLPEPHRRRAWEIVGERCRELDALIPVSRFYAGVMTPRLGVDPARVHPVWAGIRTAGYEPATVPPAPPVVGFLARMIPEKGLDTLVEAFLILKRAGRVPGLRLHLAGSMTAAERAFTDGLMARIADAGLESDVTWRPNLTHEEKLEFLRGLSVFSVPATCGEAFGLYVIEAMAAGVPVVQPRHGAFPEIVAETGGGILCEPDDPEDLARHLAGLLLDPHRRRHLGAAGRRAVLDRFTVRRMASRVLEVLRGG
jgi:glycosyltransferase involved in cell wall biosynthesis